MAVAVRAPLEALAPPLPAGRFAEYAVPRDRVVVVAAVCFVLDRGAGRHRRSAVAVVDVGGRRVRRFALELPAAGAVALPAALELPAVPLRQVRLARVDGAPGARCDAYVGRVTAPTG